MDRLGRLTAQPGSSLSLAWRALRAWKRRQWIAAGIAASAVGLLVGLATVLIPNPIFGRDIPPVWWNYPVWILTSALTGLLVATYVRPAETQAGAASDQDPEGNPHDANERRSARVGGTAGILAWFAVGCPVCNKIALLALGYTGALTWFAPLQPLLALLALIMAAVAVVWRLVGQVACPLPSAPATLRV